MEPRLSFHDVASIELTPVLHFPSEKRPDGGAPFWSRDIVLVGKNGERFKIDLFTRDPDGLAVRDLDFAEEPKCALPEPAPTASALVLGVRDAAVEWGKCVGDYNKAIAGAPIGDFKAASHACDTSWGVLMAAIDRLATNGGTKPWTPPPSPRPHTYPEHGGNCTQCGAVPKGALSRLACGTAKLSPQDRAVAAAARRWADREGV